MNTGHAESKEEDLEAREELLGALKPHWRWEKQDWWCSHSAVATTNSG